ncbi:hypothetical protein N9K67_09095 [Opitutaceae bacterium]|nr:hypothetical protein [Opitutaceae bacterium]
MSLSNFLLEFFLPDPTREFRSRCRDLEGKCKQGCSNSCVELFKLREKEFWEEQSFSFKQEARDWLLRAIKSGSREAILLYGKHYYESDKNECVHLLEGLIQSGDNEASHLLAKRLLENWDNIQDKTQAIERYKALESRGDKRAALILAEQYFYGAGGHVERDHSVALSFLKRADTESPEVNRLIGSILLAGISEAGTKMKPSPQNALVHFLKAANSGPTGCASSQYLAGIIILKHPTLGSVHEAVNLLTRANTSGAALASYRLCMLYHEGTVIEKNKEEAYFYALVAEQGLSDAISAQWGFMRDQWLINGDDTYLEYTSALSQAAKTKKELQSTLEDKDIENIEKKVKSLRA